jgi:hypothetical protein
VDSEPISNASRGERARRALEPYWQGPDAGHGAALAAFLADAQHLLGPEAMEVAGDAGRLKWHRDQIGETGISWGSPRPELWRSNLLHNTVVGGYFQSWPTELQDRIIDACVDAETTLMSERLAQEPTEDGATLTWDPAVGAIRSSHPDADIGVGIPNSYRQRDLHREVYLAVLDQFPSIQQATLAAFIEEKEARLEQLGYSVEFESDFMAQTYTLPRIPERSITCYDSAEKPLRIATAETYAHFAALADGLPDLDSGPNAPRFARWQEVATAHVPGFTDLPERVRRELISELVDLETDTINEALEITDCMWDPVQARAIAIPGEQPRVDPADVGTQVAAAQDQTIEAAGHIFTTVIANRQGTAPEGVAAHWSRKAAQLKETGAHAATATRRGRSR